MNTCVKLISVASSTLYSKDLYTHKQPFNFTAYPYFDVKILYANSIQSEHSNAILNPITLLHFRQQIIRSFNRVKPFTVLNLLPQNVLQL